MPYKNPTELLIAATQLPAAIEKKLPEGAPKLSETLVDIANKLPKVPDLPVELPDLPAPPEFPELPALPGAELRRYVTGVEVRPLAPAPTPARTPVTPLVQAYTQPIEGVVGQVITRRGM